MRHRLPKSELLRGYRSFATVISSGKSLFVSPVRCYYIFDTQGVSRTTVGFSVTKKVKNSSERNHIRRRMREAYRLHKHLLEESPKPGGLLKMVFLFIGRNQKVKKNPGSQSIHRAINLLLPRVREEISAAAS